jgi:hypothetical protein
MDIKQYQKDRKKELASFKRDYDELKLKYNRLLNEAVYEKDESIRDQLVKQVLSVNSELAEHVRGFISNSTDKFDTAMINSLTNELIAYQNEATEIKNSTDKISALQRILHKKSTKLESIRWEFNMFLSLLLGGIVVVLYLIFITPTRLERLFPAPLLSSTAM